MRVWMVPSASATAEDRGGIATLIRSYEQHAGFVSIEYVDDPDKADVWAVHAGIKTGLRGKPLVSHVHGLYWTAEDNLTNEYHSQVNASVIESMREAHVVTVPSNWVAQALRRDMHLNPEILRHGISYGKIDSTKPSGHYLLWNKNRIGDACSPDAVEFLAKRFPKREFQTTLWDRPPLENVHVIGLQSHKDMLDIVEKTFIYLSTAKETFGIGTLEALAAGVPVLGWAEGGNLDLVKHKETGYLAEPGNYADLAAGYLWLEANRMRMRDACTRSVRAHDWYQVMRTLFGIYKKAIRIFKERNERKVTVVIPAYNKASTLARTIDSVLNQTLAPAEILVVDNNSTDTTPFLVEQYQEKGVKYINERYQGVAHARNRGIREASSPYICCLDADDAIAPTFLEVCTNALIEDPTLGVAYTRLLPFVDGVAQTRSEWPNAYDFEAFLQKRNQVPTCTVFRKEVAVRLGGYRQRYAPKGAGAEDAEFYLRMGARGYKAKLATQEPLFWYSFGQGITAQAGYSEVDWTYWHPWTKEMYRSRMPFASLAKTRFGAHPVRSYSNPTISVIIPCAEHHLQHIADALDSLEAQSYVNWEAIVVFDFPNHEYVDGVQWIRQAYPFAKYLHCARKGAGVARNWGAEQAVAKNLLFLDADDFLHPTALEKLWSTQRSHVEKPIVYSDYTGHAFIEENMVASLRERNRLLSFDASDRYAHIAHQSFDYDCEKALRQPEEGQEPYIWCLVSALVPKVYHLAIGGFDESMKSWEDWDYWLRMARAGFCFERIAERLIDYRFYSGTRRESGRQLAKELLQYLREKYKGERPMPCGSCGKQRARMIAQQNAQMPTPLAAPQFQGAPMMSNDFVFVQLNDHNIGTHHIMGGVTRNSYGYRSHGDEFLIARMDYEARKDLFILLEEPVRAVAEEPVAQIEQPEEGTLEAVEGMTPVLLRSLNGMNVRSLGDIDLATAGALQDIPGITTVMQQRILEAARKHSAQFTENTTSVAETVAPKKSVGRPKGSAARS